MQNFEKKTIKKILQKNRKIMKNLKCKMKKMTYPPIYRKQLLLLLLYHLFNGGRPQQTKT